MHGNFSICSVFSSFSPQSGKENKDNEAQVTEKAFKISGEVEITGQNWMNF